MKFNIKLIHYILAFTCSILLFVLYLFQNALLITLGIFPWIAIEAIWFFIFKSDTLADEKALNLLFSFLFLITAVMPLLEVIFFGSNFFSINKEIVYLMENEIVFFILYILLIIFFLLYFIVSLIYFFNLRFEQQQEQLKVIYKNSGIKPENLTGRLNLPEIEIKPFIPEDEQVEINAELEKSKEIKIEEEHIFEREKTENQIQEDEKDEEINNELNNEINNEIDNKTNNEIKDEIKYEIEDKIKDEMKDDLKNDMKNKEMPDKINNKIILEKIIDLNENFEKENFSKDEIEVREEIEIKDIIENEDNFKKEKISEIEYKNYAIENILPKVLHPHILADEDDDKITEEKAAIILKTLKDFGIESKLLNYIKGPVVTRFELEIDEKVNLGKIINLEKNITYNLSAEKIRILAPIPGKKAVGIEIPNEIKQIVYFTDLAKSDEFKNSNMNLPFILGKDIEGKTIVTDISKSPHLLIAGRTGSGKSVCINTLIASLVIANPPERVRLLLIDPKRVELSLYNDLPHLLTDEIIIYPEDASAALKWLVAEMENRYSILKEHSVRSIEDYNQIMEEKLPYLVLIIDEFYALMQTAQKIIEDSLIHLSAMARAVGIHLIFATQRPSAEVVTGVIKSNLPSRIAFQTFSKTDSRIILDTSGAESLLGNGDMLFSFAGLPPVRIQGAFISTNEVRELVKKISEKYKTERKAINELFSDIKIEENGYNADESFIDDPLYPQAVEIVKRERKVSASYLQRRLKIGYNRAARIVEKMEEDGLISSLIDGKKREIYI
ncbi:MAG TPA: DNA translocase FtsK [Exilispira sp.]|nr:DNA translocase FtsK [Exilispira sp.]